LFWQKIEKSSKLSKMPDSPAEALKLSQIAPFSDYLLTRFRVIVIKSAHALESK